MTKPEQRKRILLFFPGLVDKLRGGVLYKQQAIAQAFLRSGCAVDLITFSTAGAFYNDTCVYSFSSIKLIRRLQYHLFCWSRINHILRGDYSLVWSRAPLPSPLYVRHVALIRRINKSAIIILEYGNYPYTNELSILAKIVYLFFRFSEDRLHSIVNYAITYSPTPVVSGLKEITFSNGVDTGAISWTPTYYNIDAELRMICVSSLLQWHGFDRIIHGISIYLQSSPKVQIHLDVVGDGPDQARLMQLVSNYNLSDYIEFHGFVDGLRLDSLYRDSHICISSLAMHRIGLMHASSLKNREYASRGLPIVMSAKDTDFPESLPWVLYVSQTDDPLDIAKIHDFAVGVYRREGISASIRQYAESNLNWDAKILNLINQISL